MLRELERSGLLRDPEMASQTKPLSDTDSDVISELVAAYDESLRITVDETVSRETAHTVIDLANIAEVIISVVFSCNMQVPLNQNVLFPLSLNNTCIWRPVVADMIVAGVSCLHIVMCVCVMCWCGYGTSKFITCH